MINFSDNIQHKNKNSTPKSFQRPIGEILIERGILNSDDVARINAVTLENKLPFGEAAISLGLLTKQQLENVLSYQFSYPCLVSDNSELNGSLIAAYNPFCNASENLRSIRSNIDLAWCGKHVDNKMISIVGPTDGAGRTFIAANLAIMFAQLGRKTLLIDGNIRKPEVHKVFGIKSTKGFSELLSDRIDSNPISKINDIENLFVLPAGASAPNPVELLSGSLMQKYMSYFCESYDFIIVDTPSSDKYSDSEVISSVTKASVIVCRKNQTPIKDVKELKLKLASIGVSVLGAIFNILD